MTIVDIRATDRLEERIQAARAWAGDVGRAYSAQHELARGWIREALGTRRR